ncbi:40-kDa huntingtin-associated protein-like [Rhynchophorus ferrugineus]|uniref:40-kDa huntingtin-associated protein-like n=1 Tax=Rhynchophorus ferrugineus TaxID=354439 RepID=UPI003FCEA462
MANEGSGCNILERYRNISNKLKKRFLRKPNEMEGAESFASLGRYCESQDLNSYAALSWTAASRCEGILGNTVGETAYLVRATRQFLKSEKNDIHIGFVSVPTENLQAGLNSCMLACTKYPKDSILQTGLYLELVDFLKEIGKIELMQPYLKGAIQLSQGKHDTNIHCLEKFALHFISIGDYVSALQTYQEIMRIIDRLPKNGYRCDILLKCEINSVFLLLILRPNTLNIAPNLAKILEKYTWGDKSDNILQACKMSEMLFILLQSLVVICQSLDKSSLEDLEVEFWPFLSSEQKNLLRVLIKLYCH